MWPRCADVSCGASWVRRSNVYGLTLLVFNSECRIAEVLTFMQPFPLQRRQLLKPELQ